jgi:hypothetical protein
LGADSCLIALSIILFIAAMLFEGVIFLPIDSVLKFQVQTFTAYIFTASIVILAVVGASSVFKRKL